MIISWYSQQWMAATSKSAEEELISIFLYLMRVLFAVSSPIFFPKFGLGQIFMRGKQN